MSAPRIRLGALLLQLGYLLLPLELRGRYRSLQLLAASVGPVLHDRFGDAFDCLSSSLSHSSSALDVSRSFQEPRDTRPVVLGVVPTKVVDTGEPPVTVKG